MKLKTPSFLMSLMACFLSALMLTLGTPTALAAVPHSTDDGILNLSSNRDSVLVGNYVAMLQDLSAKNEDEQFYDADSMSGQILCTVDEAGNRTYQAVEEKSEEVMQGLTSNDVDYFSGWLSHQTIEPLSTLHQGAFKVASADKTVGASVKNPADAATALILTPHQVKKFEKTGKKLNKLSSKPLHNNIFEQKAILTAIMSYLVSLGLGTSASTINAVATALGKAATALAVIGFVPVAAEFMGHLLEGRARSQAVNEKEEFQWLNIQGEAIQAKRDFAIQAEKLVKQEAANKKNTDTLKKIQGIESHPMVYGYLSPMGERFSRFATNWRSFWSPAFKLLGINIATDELHLPSDQMEAENIKQALNEQEQRASKAGELLDDMSGEATRYINKSFGGDQGFSLTSQGAQVGANVLRDLQQQQQGCLVRSFRYCTDGVANYFSGKIEALDNWWENYQVEIRNGGIKPDSTNSNSTSCSVYGDATPPSESNNRISINRDNPLYSRSVDGRAGRGGRGSDGRGGRGSNGRGENNFGFWKK